MTLRPVRAARRWSTRGLVALAVAAAVSLAAASGSATAEVRKDWKGAAAKVDDLIRRRLAGEKDLVVAPTADDAEFLRRATLDLTGTIPSEAEATAFLQDPSADKRAALVDRLLASSQHGEWFATWYSNLLVGTSIRDRNMNRRTFNDWMRDQWSRNRPYDELVYDLMTATGNSDSNGAVGLVSSFDTSAADAAGKTSRYFLGVQIQCAQCHDHPYDKRIKQEDFRAYAAFFFTTTVRRNQTPGNPEISFDVASFSKEDLAGYRGRGARMTGRPGQPLRLDPPAKGVRPPPIGELPDAKFLLGKTLKDVPGLTRREVLAKWMTSKSNEWFAQAFANRLWAYFTGRGIVHPVDDFSNTNKPVHPELLAFLGEEFARSGFDVNHLCRVICATEAYQRTSKMPRNLERPDPSLWAVGAVRPLTVEQSLNALLRASGKADEDARRAGAGAARAAMGGRGMLVDPRMLFYQLFRRSFQDDEAVESEEFTGTIPRGLLMMNGPQVNGMLAASPGSPLRTILDGEKSDRERIRRVYVTVLSRDPSPSELKRALDHVHTSRDEKEGYEDLFWALCNTTEFMSNH